MAEDSHTSEVFQRACRHVGLPDKFAQDTFVERVFQERMSPGFLPDDFALVLGNPHLEVELVDFFKEDESSPGQHKHWLFSSAMRNFRRSQSSGSGAGAPGTGFRSISQGTIIPKVESPPLCRRHKTKIDVRPIADHKCVCGVLQTRIVFHNVHCFSTIRIVFHNPHFPHNAHCEKQNCVFQHNILNYTFGHKL